MFSDAVYVAAATGPLAILLDRIVGWLRNRRRDEAETGLAIDQRWANLANRLDQRVTELEDRVGDLEAELARERARAQGLAAEVDRYRRIARSLVRHVIKLRDALAVATSEPAPDLPADIEEAITTLDLP